MSQLRSQAPSAPITVTIASGGSLTAAIDLGSNRLARIVMPSAWTSAALSFQSSYDGTNFADLFNKDGEVSLAASTVVAASRAIAVDPTVFFGIRYLKIRSGLTGAAVNQGAERSLILATVPR